MLDTSKTESLTVAGRARDVLMADTMAWAGLESVLGSDPAAGWFLKVMQHTLVPPPPDAGEDARNLVDFAATFYRHPEGAEEEALV